MFAVSWNSFACCCYFIIARDNDNGSFFQIYTESLGFIIETTTLIFLQPFFTLMYDSLASCDPMICIYNWICTIAPHIATALIKIPLCYLSDLPVIFSCYQEKESPIIVQISVLVCHEDTMMPDTHLVLQKSSFDMNPTTSKGIYGAYRCFLHNEMNLTHVARGYLYIILKVNKH